MDTDLCRLADHRGFTRYVYSEPMVEGVDYTHRLTDPENNIAHTNSMFSTGFPMVPDMNPSIGTLEVAFLAIDFPDSPGSETQLAQTRIVGRIARQVPARISDGRAGRQCEHHGHNGGADR